MAVLHWAIENIALLTAGLLILLRFIESGLMTHKWDIVSLLKEFLTLR